MRTSQRWSQKLTHLPDRLANPLPLCQTKYTLVGIQSAWYGKLTSCFETDASVEVRADGREGGGGMPTLPECC